MKQIKSGSSLCSATCCWFAGFLLLPFLIPFTSFGQGAVTATWALTANQNAVITGAGSGTATAPAQTFSSLLFAPVSNTYLGTGTVSGLRASPKGTGSGADGDWVQDAASASSTAAIEGRYMEFVLEPNTGYDLSVSNITFDVGNRSNSGIKSNVYYYIGSSNASFTKSTGTLMGWGLGPSTTNVYSNYSYNVSLTVYQGQKVYFRIYPYNVSAATTGKYLAVKAVSISGTTAAAVCNNAGITTNPSAASVCNGNGTQTMSVVASGTNPTYQWQYSAVSGGPYTNVANNTPTGITYSGTTTATLTATAGSTASTGGYYRCVVTVPCNGSTANSNEALLSVLTAPTVSAISGPTVTQGTASGNLNFTAGNSPNQYSLVYNAAALAQGFSSVSNVSYTNPISLVIPVAAAAGSYTGTLQLINSVNGCSSIAGNFTVTITATPVTAYYWIGGVNASLTDQTSWSSSVGGAPVGASGTLTLSSSSLLIFDGADISNVAGSQTGSVTANYTAAFAAGQIILRNNATVTLNANPAAAIASSIGNQNAGINSNGYTTTDTDLDIPSGCTLSFSNLSSNTATFSLATNASASVAGTLQTNAATVYNTDGTGVVTTVSGVLYNAGTPSSLGMVCTSNTRLILTATGTYRHHLNGGTIPTATWNTGSVCMITGTTSAGSFNGQKQTFSRFIWDCAGQTGTKFVLGQNSSSTPPNFVVTDTFTVRRTNGKLLQLTSSGGQRDIVVGNYIQYGGTVAVTFETDDVGVQRSLTASKLFYVSDSLEANTRFQLINNPAGQNTIGRLFVGGQLEMHKVLGRAYLEKVGASSTAELWFTGTAAQQVKLDTLAGAIDFVNNHTGSGVYLASNAAPNKFRLMAGTFFIGSNHLSIADSVTYPSPGTGLLGGTNTSELTLGAAHKGSSLKFALGYQTVKNLNHLTGSVTTLGSRLAICAGTSPGRDSLATGSTFNTSDSLILRSDAGGTARIAPIPVDGSGLPLATLSGKVTAERYIPMDNMYTSRRWRLLGTPFKSSGAPTINAAWQCGVSNPDRLNPLSYNPRPGYGTHITRSTVFAADGYDQGSTNNSSIYFYSSGGWSIPSSTNAVSIAANSGAYMVFIRGDRSIIISNQFVNANTTTLDPTGNVNTGRVSIPMAASGYQTVTNPYPSAIKLDNVQFGDTAGNRKTILLWDPKTAGSFGVGKFVTCQGDGGSPATYTYTGNTSNYQLNPGTIESSGAFMIPANGGSITFNESNKIAGSSHTGIASRPQAGSAGSPVYNSRSLTKLYIDMAVTTSYGLSLADGAALVLANRYNNDVDNWDAPKYLTFSTKEELSILRDQQRLAIERRNFPAKTDTLFLYLNKMAAASYQFTFRPENFPGHLIPVLVDRYTDSTWTIERIQESTYPFTVTTDSASFATNRFYILLSRKNAVRSLITGIRERAVTPAAATTFASMQVAPSPAQEPQFTIATSNLARGIWKVELYDTNGSMIYKVQGNHAGGAFKQRIQPGEHLPATGTYQVRLILNNEIQSVRSWIFLGN